MPRRPRPRAGFVYAGTALRAIRRRLGWTQAQLARALGLHPNSLACMERGEAPIRRAWLLAAQAFLDSP